MLDVVVTRRSRETASVAMIEFASATDELLPPFAAGDHVDVHLAEGLTRQYSLCNAPGERDIYRLGVMLANKSRGGSRTMHALKVGEKCRISRPRNAFRLREDAAKSILIGGGIGITPLMAMAYRLSDLGAAFELHYSARSKLHAAFYKSLSKSPFGSNIRWHFDNADGKTTFNPYESLADPSDSAHLYVCGPSGFMDYIREKAEELGWKRENVHYETFEALGPGADAREFVIHAKRSARDITVRANQTAAQALSESGMRISVSCEQGICGTCMVPLLDGEADHKDSYQTQAERTENPRFALCCSRAISSRIVLDI
ncbi:PDR/VanB family oxidoreductase [Ensifer adhaerens]|uniref:PDR/VanB family oxidoreductase n=1 Tax=Ensifer adhaerens TaxID=106592 RepID=UPI001CBFC8B4|nr:PDR/VanB family oxidoreductase [Ensifer adhaerens]MBZ7924238.1 PDR/VanB family oxidoreductase [Ensifer adhaerens]UAX96508.1 PDR/VanB family oxidoreductase [Ensifer adhaerens]UAY04148.1 PDR/VanB family oxidoreductase [Ensifer adhaerens]UAY12134.1 PDR/VanB family oxidoreductase [Ensifer adhaerens]